MLNLVESNFEEIKKKQEFQIIKITLYLGLYSFVLLLKLLFFFSHLEESTER